MLESLLRSLKLTQVQASSQEQWWANSASHQQQGGGELEEVEEGHDEKGLVQQIVEEEGRLLWQGLAQDREQGARACRGM